MRYPLGGTVAHDNLKEIPLDEDEKLKKLLY
jgi:hypothetical protein